ncbi:hypothetical protein CYMTET_20897 [Cymbomonas tetramitiformis]|uniref:beta-glucosidase n=1 Tax=Cymbomonas tetramitiformis TaxID=36881 RepID=A0AAE0G341_9CHLO|nr:hypothetical protein CYMTET_20897 [Cymbomonas tetramitiformis]
MDLLSRMTLEERQVQLHSVHDLDPSIWQRYKNTSFGDQKMSHFPQRDALSLLRARNQEQAYFLQNSRLHIPLSFHQETLTTVGPGGTNFPLGSTIGSSFNVSLAGEIGKVIAKEAQAVGVDVGYAPEINLYTDPRNGRGQEAFSQDAFLTSELAVAWVLGMQGGDVDSLGPRHYLSKDKVACVAKHYIAYGASQGGLNSGPAMIDEYTLRDVYLAPWEAVVRRAGLRALMRSHEAWNHWPIHASTYLADIINKLGFNDSFSISDCGDLHDLIRAEAATSEVEAAAMGLNASVDVENRCGTEIYDHVIEAIHAGMLAESTLNTSVARVLRHKFSAGLFDKPYQSEKGLVEMRSPRHLQLSLEAAQQGVVVLKNAPLAAARDAILPLDLEKFAGRTIAVIGPLGACTEGSPQCAHKAHPIPVTVPAARTRGRLVLHSGFAVVIV